MRVPLIAALLLASLMVAPSAHAASPTLFRVGQHDRHPTATFSAPGADDGAIYFARSADRATDGSFLEENIADLDLLSDDEISAGNWVYESQLDPGLYYAMLRASDFDCLGDENPACVDG